MEIRKRISETMSTYRDRRAASIENNAVRVTVLVEGGHIAEICHKQSGVNPLWTPPWPSIEPSTYTLEKHPEYGVDSESKLLAGIMGHNLCLDIFGPPSAEEAAAGLTVHGEASVVPYRISTEGRTMTARADLPLAQLQFERRITVPEADGIVRVEETVENLSAADRPIAWTQHVTIGPPFLQKGSSQFRASATRSRVHEEDLEGSRLKPGADFDWPMAPRKDEAAYDLQTYTDAPESSEFTTHLMDPTREHAFFMAWSPVSHVLFGYLWKCADFPWLGIWEENYSRKQPPWSGKTLTRGLEFGASPMAETRREMIDRNKLFGVPAYRWLPSKAKLRTGYCIFILTRDRIPERVSWNGTDSVEFE